MIIIGLALIGAIFGVISARRRSGNGLDMAQYGASYGIAFAIVGLLITVFVDRMI